MNQNSTKRFMNLSVLSNLVELVVTTMESAGGNETVSKEVPEMAQDAAAILNKELGEML